jgi:glucosamine--fructose-6-phosphate aminotransferase (isomerizing)
VCGIFGIFPKQESTSPYLNKADLSTFSEIGNNSTRRGMDASGLVFSRDRASYNVIKGNLDFKKLFRKAKKDLYSCPDLDFLVGHTRLATHGDSASSTNNHPIISENWLVVHNGWVTNYRDIFSTSSLTEKNSGADIVDSYSINLVLENYSNSNKSSFHGDLAIHLARLEGELTFFALHRSGFSFLFTNVGNIYFYQNSDRVIFASEPDFFSSNLKPFVSQLPKNIIYELSNFNVNSDIHIKDLAGGVVDKKGKTNLLLDLNYVTYLKKLLSNQIFQLGFESKSIYRCKKCLLPETFPSIIFTDDGICQHCVNFVCSSPTGIEKVYNEIIKISPSGKVILGLSGGRDSCYLAHLSTEIGLSPIAVTYDWGLISNSARENMAKITGKLGLEHVLIARNTFKVKKRVRKSLKAVLNSKDSRFIPLLMAGDKSWMSIAKKVAKYRGNLPVLMGIQKYENTGFKTIGLLESKGFFLSNEKSSVGLSPKVLIKMLTAYFLFGIRHPYILGILFTDGLKGFIDYYFFNSEIINLLDSIDYDPQAVELLLRERYNFNFVDLESDDTWRAGDMTSHLYDVLYFKHLKFTEKDVMISNLIRNGKITTQQGLSSINNIERINFNLIFDYANYIEIDYAWLLRKLINY